MKKAQCGECGRAGGYALYCLRCAEEMLNQSEQEPVAYINVEQRKLEWAKYMSWDTPTVVNLPKIPLYTNSPQRTWVGLTQDELTMICDSMKTWSSFTVTDVYFAIEAKLKDKNSC